MTNKLKHWIDKDTNLTQQQLKAIELLKDKPVSEVASELKISARAIYRWLNQPDFSLRFNEEMSSILQQASMSWVAGFSEATEILRAAAKGEAYNGQPVTSQQIKASTTLARHMPALLESLSLHVRLNALEARLSELGFNVE